MSKNHTLINIFWVTSAWFNDGRTWKILESDSESSGTSSSGERSPNFCSDSVTFLDFHPPQSQRPSSRRPWFFFFFLVTGFLKNLECHAWVLSAYLAAKQSFEVKECILLSQSSFKRIGKQVPARPLTLPPCGGVRLRRRRSRIKLLRAGSLAPLHSPWLTGRVLYMYGNEP